MIKEINKQINKLNSRLDWIDFLRNIIFEISKPIQFNEINTLELLIKIDNVLDEVSYIKRNQYHNYLMDIYINLGSKSNCLDKIVMMHYLFSRIKPIGSAFNYIERQIKSEELIQLNSDNVNLHASLLSCIRTFVSIDNVRTIREYIFSKIDKIYNPKVLDSVLVFLYRKSSKNDFFLYLTEIISNKTLSSDTIKVINDSLEWFYYENGEIYDDLAIWYQEMLIKMKFNKNKNLIELDNLTVDWLNYESTNIQNNYFGMVFLSMINLSYMLPFEHYRIIDELEPEQNNDAFFNRGFINNEAFKLMVDRGLSYEVKYENDSPDYNDTKIVDCYYFSSDESLIDKEISVVSKRLKVSNKFFQIKKMKDFLLAMIPFSGSHSNNKDHVLQPI